MKKILIVAICIIAMGKTYAQNESNQEVKNSFKTNYFADLSLGSNGESNIGSLSFGHLWGLGKRKQWRLGYGLRLSSYIGSKNRNYVSANPDFYQVDAKTDTVVIKNPQQNNFTIFITGTYRIKNRFELGFNLDLLGYSFGGSQTATFLGNNSAQPIATNVSASFANVTIYDKYDIGFVKSEFMAGYWLNDKWMARLGFSTFITEYRTDIELQKDNKRFKAFDILPFIAIRYSPKHN